MIKEYFGFSGDSGMGLYMLLCVGGVCVVMGGVDLCGKWLSGSWVGV